MPELKGLPEGVEAVEVRTPLEGEYFWWGSITRCNDRNHTASILVVRPKPGFSFLYDIMTDSYKVTRQLPCALRVTAVFLFETEEDAQMIDRLRQLKGLVSLAHEFTSTS